MSLLNTVLDIASLGVDIANANKLHQLQQQNAGAAAIQVVVQMLRDEIFKYRRVAEELLSIDDAEPKIMAGAMRILEQRLQVLGIKPEMFPDLNDKQYALTTIRFIHDNSQRLIAGLPRREQLEVEQVANDTVQLQEIDDYIETYPKVQIYRHAVKTTKELGTLNHGCARNLAALGTLVVFGVVFSVLGQLAAVFSNQTSSTFNGILGLILMAISLAIAFGVALLYGRKARRRDYSAAKKTISNLENELDLASFVELESRLGTDYNHVLKLRNQAQQRIELFFKHSVLLSTINS